jgi:hypothetical protein
LEECQDDAIVPRSGSSLKGGAVFSALSVDVGPVLEECQDDVIVPLSRSSLKGGAVLPQQKRPEGRCCDRMPDQVTGWLPVAAANSLLPSTVAA